MTRSPALAVVLLLPVLASAAKLRDVEVSHEDGRYYVHSEAWFDAPIENVYAVFLDWDLSPQFSSAVVEARDLPAEVLGRPGWYSRNRGCVLFFCMSFERYGYVEHEPFEYIAATAIPEKSDFRVSEERWQFREENGGTVVTYALVMEPKFWLPPLIGPYAIKRKLEKRGGDALDRIEAVAQNYVADGR